MNGTYHLSVSVVDVVLLVGRMNSVWENCERIMGVQQGVNRGGAKYTFVACEEIAEQNQEMKAANEPFNNVKEFKYLGTTLTSQNCIDKQFKFK